MAFESTYLHDIAALGGMAPVGSGSLGGTVWTQTTLIESLFESTYLHDIAALGGMAPVGSGSLGGTVWEKVL